RNSRTNVVAATRSAIHGSVAPRLPSSSASSAVAPPTYTWAPGGAGTARTWATSARAAGGSSLAANRRATLATSPAALVTGAAVTPGTWPRRAVYAASAARSAGPLTGPSNLTTASIGEVALAGKSRARASATTRGAEPDGRTRASVPPQVIERNGAASASSAITMTAR